MKFVEMTGKTLAEVVKTDELHGDGLEAAGVDDHTIVRINEHGDIEIRLTERWAVIGGLLGDYADRVRERTGLDWV
jgi:hypothetical protein